MNSIPEIGQTVLNFVDGRWEAGAAEKWTDRYDPADQSVLVARAPDSSREDARRAIEAAARAAERWNQLTAPSRGRLLFEWLAWIDAHKAKLAELLTREEGKILPESVGEVKRSMDILEFTAGMGRRLNGRVFPSEEDGVFCYATPQPLGVVGLISPWNFPVAIPVWKLAPALVAGNTAVLKPSPLTPLTATALVRGLEEVGVPPGVVNLVHGDSEPGVELISNSAVRGVSFTGSTKVGKMIAKAASDRLLKLQLELGGKNPQIVLEDADLDLAVSGVMVGGLGSTGQRCTATSRALVMERVYDDFLNRLVARASAIRVGPGMETGVDIGPLVDSKAMSGVSHYANVGREEGARFCTGGSPLSGQGLERGFFFAPTVVEAKPDMTIAQEEIFGPFVSVIRVRDLDEALGIANSVRYGLSSTIFTRDVGRVFKFAERAQAGVIHVNRPGVGGYSHAPFGGIKESGYGGREVGDEVMSFYTETKMVYVNYR
ncbi:MAG TPA: aldehyde dehydrogenase family protein [Blastocatellia bacterium]|nr:aldehyde dehydrogenase family protein [Blastocatellia bacterium]